MVANVPETMRAAIYEAYGEPAKVVRVADSVPVPSVGPKDVLIKVHSASVNPVDWKIIMGYLKAMFDLKPSASNPVKSGKDVSGVVVQVGSEVTAFKEGDKVYAMARIGSFAEYVAVDEALVSLKPESVSFDEAAALPLVTLTSYQALFEHAKLQKGERVLVIGGSGGTGSAAIQLAHDAGAHVTTTCSGRNVEYVRSLGADEVVDYTKSKFSEVLPERSFDVVYTCALGGELSDVAKVIKPNGRFVDITVVGYKAEEGAAPLDFSSQVIWTNSNGRDLDAIRKLVDSGKFKLEVDESFPLDRVNDAIAKNMSNRTRGKVVVKVL